MTSDETTGGDIVRRPDGKTFDEFRRVNEHGAEYWNARELQPLLGYGQWRSFENAIRKAVTSCKHSGNDPGYHFARARKMIELAKGAVRGVTDYHLSRFACYLIAGWPIHPQRGWVGSR